MSKKTTIALDQVQVLIKNIIEGDYESYKRSRIYADFIESTLNRKINQLRALVFVMIIGIGGMLVIMIVIFREIYSILDSLVSILERIK